MSFTYSRLGRCLRFVSIYACIAVFLCFYHFSVNKVVYKLDVCDCDGDDFCKEAGAREGANIPYSFCARTTRDVVSFM